jgi:anti-sigma factor RsiW
MNCNQVRDRLLAWQYGELSAGEQAEVEAHLAGCSTCREESSAWRGFRRRLEAFKGPALQIDLPRIYQQAAQRHERRVRRWRRTALAVLGLAAAVLIAVSLKLEIRVEASQVVLGWGGSANTPPQPAAEAGGPLDQIRAEDLESIRAWAKEMRTQSRIRQVNGEDLELVTELIRALAKDVQTRDRQQQDALLRFQARFETLLVRAMASNERDVAALYNAYVRIPKKGGNP